MKRDLFLIRQTIHFLEEFLKTQEKRGNNEPKWSGPGIMIRAEDLLRKYKEMEKAEKNRKSG